MAKRVFIHSSEIVVKLFLSIVGIICIGALPGLFQGLKVDFHKYIETIKMVCNSLLHLSSMTYMPVSNSTRPTPKPLFPQLFIHYKETMIIFLAAFFISLLIAFLIVYIVLRSNARVQKKIKSFLLFLESIPDILLIIGSQLFVIWIFKQTGILAVSISGVGEQSVRGLPIICLSVPTTIMFVKLVLLRFETELEKDYVLFAKAKGLDKLYILNHHVLRNVLLSTLFFTKTNIWFMLSNLYIIEWMFNTYGMFVFVRVAAEEHFATGIPLFTVSLLLLYIPIFIIFKLFHYLVPNAMKERL
ncbi:peptide/nickel transport system permease protein [Bacillus sp. 491mf]|uniref:ABC transporter permease subunit n=1 Tax=Bacillus sp. 491mf TaxID=1761755 RepID=UPI0008EAE7F1|nr:ABC transporter permease subunit [Bacillus sp. 491mf]SFD27653.1 peptide/nickel transport system permease protein [Bacillus sp. 491mf]